MSITKSISGAGVNIGARDTFDRALNAMLLSVLIGFISGYGGRDPSAMRPRELAMVDRALSPHGLGGVVLALTGGRVEPTHLCDGYSDSKANSPEPTR